MKKYRTKVDWWMYLITAAVTAAAVYMVVDMPNLGMALFALFLASMMPFCIWSIWYAIDGNTLIVHFMFTTERLPIDKISEVKLTTGMLASAAASTKRVSIQFSDRKVLKSYAPLEISPKDRVGFIKDLLKVNPHIKTYINNASSVS